MSISLLIYLLSFIWYSWSQPCPEMAQAQDRCVIWIEFQCTPVQKACIHMFIPVKAGNIMSCTSCFLMLGILNGVGRGLWRIFFPALYNVAQDQQVRVADYLSWHNAEMVWLLLRALQDWEMEDLTAFLYTQKVNVANLAGEESQGFWRFRKTFYGSEIGSSSHSARMDGCCF